MRTPVPLRRVEATQLTLDRYRDQPLVYGRTDCVQMAAFHLRAMGHKVLLSKGGRYRSALGAAKALKRAGFDTLADALDAMGLERIPPAAATAGDILSIPSASPLGCLTVALGNGRTLGWIDADEVPGAAVLQPVMYETGWRVTWQKR